MSDKEEVNKPRKLQTPLGVFDILPDDQLYYTHIKKVVRHRCRQSGFRRITTPIFEFTDVFQRSIGDGTDIVQKEMYTFLDRNERSLTLKPEGTAGVVRAYLEHGMKELPQPVELYYIEPHFRYDRPQKGRYRQFWQFGYEIIGESDPALDAQIVHLSCKILDDLGITALFKLQVNSIGCQICREKFLVELQNYYIGKERSMCSNCLERLHKNPLRILDCKEEDCQILAKFAPKLKMYLCEECKEYHQKFLEYLTEVGLKYTENEQLVRGLDYYTKTVFEFWDHQQGAQNSIGGGGRYDGLVELMGGQPTPAVGVAFGIERIIQNMKREKIKIPSKDNLHIFVAQLGDEAKKKCLNLIWELRERGVRTVGALGKASMKAQLKLADRFNVPYTLILGITEVREGTIIIRDMARGQQRIVPFETIIDEVIRLIGEKNLDLYSPAEILYE
ncbi:MAG: histidyl-tRNA synthetase, histidyl-tRNA synthetase [Candidatus Peregrinibacteria bacterium GW2011_GWE2_39_6]|nr:MAG: histidyl-tRNA synthetase, histidyl-tRNA synthetase [Candidatus Peregrinibacteria bacterium GW2011_GWF2_39_17]KKR26345.1 MAG: histidyl-tRNA synthetase, histidyl-tRNA synthetase [Candidatus Peregrinibacteria bacterium GW2011_GWE2_39_6]HCW32826.1 histidine--tRNA ligase [Candidatus Peregrinibacteria bacterium]